MPTLFEYVKRGFELRRFVTRLGLNPAGSSTAMWLSAYLQFTWTVNDRVVSAPLMLYEL